MNCDVKKERKKKNSKQGSLFIIEEILRLHCVTLSRTNINRLYFYENQTDIKSKLNESPKGQNHYTSPWLKWLYLLCSKRWNENDWSIEFTWHQNFKVRRHFFGLEENRVGLDHHELADYPPPMQSLIQPYRGFIWLVMAQIGHQVYKRNSHNVIDWNIDHATTILSIRSCRWAISIKLSSNPFIPSILTNGPIHRQ